MESSKKEGKTPSGTSKNKSSKSSGSSDFSSDNTTRSKRSGKRRNNASSSLDESGLSVATGASDATGTSVATGTSQSTRGYNTSVSYMEGQSSSAYSDASGISRKSDKRRQKNPSSSMQEATSSRFTATSMVEGESNERYKQPKNFMKADTAVYAANIPGANLPGASFQTTDTFVSDLPSAAYSSDQSGTSKGSRNKENIQLMPFKIKDVMEMLKDNPAYKDKSPVMIKVKEHDIDQILEGKKMIRGKAEPLDKNLQPSPVVVQMGLRNEQESFRIATGAESGRFRSSRESAQKPEKPYESMLAGAGDQQVFAMPEIQAFPMIQADPGPRMRSRPRRVSRGPPRRASRGPPPMRRSVSRSRSRRRRCSRPVRGVPRQPPPVRRVRRPMYRRQYLSPCTTFPMCDTPCPARRAYRRRAYRRRTPRRSVSRVSSTPYSSRSRPRVVSGGSRVYNTPYTNDDRGTYYPDNVSISRRSVRPAVSRVSRPAVRRVSRPSFPPPLPPRGNNCCCNQCEEKLKFIQPGPCSKKRNVWTNEYAVIPKPQVQLIDPCEELDPSIYPRADNPCIRDGQGNPLTDCIGRPLRSPIGTKFLNFSANGSVMETSVRGNFWTGQPPLCVKCPMPSNNCGQDTTHNWWMSCGYPILPNMNPFFKRVLNYEMGPC